MNRLPVNAFLAGAAALLAAAAAQAQSRQVPAAPQRAPIVIHGATVHPVSADAIENGWVVLVDGHVADVGRGDPPRLEGADYRNARGLHVWPGLIAASTQLGLTEVGAVDVTQDFRETGRVTPEVRAAVAVNPDSDLIPVTRANGILSAMVLPSGGLVSGRSSIIRLDGWTWEDLAIEADAGLVVNWPRTEPVTRWWMRQSEEEQRREIESDLRDVERIFDEAEAYLAARAAGESVGPDLRYEAMAPALRGEKPVFIRASSRGQIESAVGWALRRGLRPVIVGGTDADMVAPLLVEHDVPVIVEGVHRMPRRRDEAYSEPFTLPARLHEAGVRFCIASGAETAHERNLNHVVGTAVAWGLPHDAAMRAVTLDAAAILGVGDRLGAIEPGRSATLILTTGDPLEITTEVVAAWIDGRAIDLSSRHTQLYEKYRQKYVQKGLIERGETPSARRR